MRKMKFPPAKLVQAEFQPGLISRGSSSRSAKQRIPDRKGLAKVGIRLGVGPLVVQMNEPGRNEKTDEECAEPLLKSEVCVFN